MKKEVICLIDDDKVYQYTATKSIEASGVVQRVLVFDDGETAYTYLVDNLSTRNYLPDIIFLDINMPYMDGWEFMEEFVKLKPKLSKKITIYMVSSSIQEEDIQKANHLEEVSDYIIKPIDTEMFAKVLSNE